MLDKSKDAAYQHAIEMAAGSMIHIVDYLNEQSTKVNDKYKWDFLKQTLANVIATCHTRHYAKFNSVEGADKFLIDIMVNLSQLLNIYENRNYIIAIRVDGEEQTWPP